MSVPHENILSKSAGGSVKAEREGKSLEIVFARVDTVDSDGDLFVDGAYEARNSGGVAMSSFGHQLRSIPVGVGPIYRGDNTEMLYAPKFRTTDEAKNVEDLLTDSDYKDVIEFSYAFRPKEWTRVDREGYWFPVNYQKVEVYEISAQYAGASMDTGIKNWKSLTFGEERIEKPKQYLFIAQARLLAEGV